MLQRGLDGWVAPRAGDQEDCAWISHNTRSSQQPWSWQPALRLPPASQSEAPEAQAQMRSLSLSLSCSLSFFADLASMSCSSGGASSVGSGKVNLTV